jgi:hypothetical protein
LKEDLEDKSRPVVGIQDSKCKGPEVALSLALSSTVMSSCLQSTTLDTGAPKQMRGWARPQRIPKSVDTHTGETQTAHYRALGCQQERQGQQTNAEWNLVSVTKEEAKN